MTYIIAEPCVDVLDRACIDVCPVDCIYEAEEHSILLINPEECIDCAACEPVCPVAAIFAEDEKALQAGRRMLRHSAGNFYINDKPTGAVVGQQPFGGSRASGTNDKAGSPLNLYRWTSLRTIKETFDPPTNYRYPFMGEK